MTRQHSRGEETGHSGHRPQTDRARGVEISRPDRRVENQNARDGATDNHRERRDHDTLDKIETACILLVLKLLQTCLRGVRCSDGTHDNGWSARTLRCANKSRPTAEADGRTTLVARAAARRAKSATPR